MLNDPNNQIPGSSSNPTNNPGSSTQLPYNQMPYYPNFQNPFANAEEQRLFKQFKMQMQYNQFSQQQQQQPNQATTSQPQSDQQSFHLVDETEDEDEPERLAIFERQAQVENPESTLARRNHLQVTDEEPKHFGEDTLPRPPGAQRIAKSQRSSNSTASSGSNPTMFQEMIAQQYELERKAKMDVIKREANSKINLYNSERIAEDMRVLQIDTRGMDPADAAIINAQKTRVRALYQPQN
ncbi:hypothetical protein Tco_1087204 [Tanacetum coccineum]